MSRKLIIPAALVCATLCASSSVAGELSEHTFLLTWADENCEGFTYAEDLLKHAHRAVFDAPEADVAALREKTEAALHDIYEGDKADYCETVAFLIENPEEE